MRVSPATRHKARHYAMQAIYQWQMTGKPPTTIEAEFRSDNDMKHVDLRYFHDLVHQVPAQAEAMDSYYQPFLLGRNLEELDAITKALLRIACYELSHRHDVPYKVVINEAVSLGKKFGPTDSFKFINGVLDQLATKFRQPELKESKGQNP